jgi:hypothetical protein
MADTQAPRQKFLRGVDMADDLVKHVATGQLSKDLDAAAAVVGRSIFEEARRCPDDADPQYAMGFAAGLGRALVEAKMGLRMGSIMIPFAGEPQHVEEPAGHFKTVPSARALLLNVRGDAVAVGLEVHAYGFGPLAETYPLDLAVKHGKVITRAEFDALVDALDPPAPVNGRVRP